VIDDERATCCVLRRAHRSTPSAFWISDLRFWIAQREGRSALDSRIEGNTDFYFLGFYPCSFSSVSLAFYRLGILSAIASRIFKRVPPPMPAGGYTLAVCLSLVAQV